MTGGPPCNNCSLMQIGNRKCTKVLEKCKPGDMQNKNALQTSRDGFDLA